MNTVLVALIIFAVMFGGALLGVFLKSILPEHHLGADSKDVVKLSIGLVATMTALILGLLVGSVKNSFDSKNDEYNRICSNLVLLDRVLAQYGPETKAIRLILLAAVTARSEELTERTTDRVTKADAFKSMVIIERMQAMIRALAPADESQKELRERAISVSSEIASARWHLLGGVASAIPTPFLVMIVIWLGIIFLSFGIYAPRNGTAISALFLAAACSAGALFLVLEMNRPFDGLIHLSNRPLENAARFIGK